MFVFLVYLFLYIFLPNLLLRSFLRRFLPLILNIRILGLLLIGFQNFKVDVLIIVEFWAGVHIWLVLVYVYALESCAENFVEIFLVLLLVYLGEGAFWDKSWKHLYVVLMAKEKLKYIDKMYYGLEELFKPPFYEENFKF